MVSTEHLKPSAVATSALLLTIIRPQLFTVLSCVRLPTFFFCGCVLEAWLHPLHHAVMLQLFSVTTKLQACLKGFFKKRGSGHFELWLSVTTP